MWPTLPVEMSVIYVTSGKYPMPRSVILEPINRNLVNAYINFQNPTGMGSERVEGQDHQIEKW